MRKSKFTLGEARDAATKALACTHGRNSEGRDESWIRKQALYLGEDGALAFEDVAIEGEAESLGNHALAGTGSLTGSV